MAKEKDAQGEIPHSCEQFGFLSVMFSLDFLSQMYHEIENFMQGLHSTTIKQDQTSNSLKDMSL